MVSDVEMARVFLSLVVYDITQYGTVWIVLYRFFLKAVIKERVFTGLISLRNGTITMLYLCCKQQLCFAPIHFKMSLGNKNLETLKTRKGKKKNP